MKRSLVILSFCFLFFCCNKKEDDAPPVPVQYNVTVTASEGGRVSTSGGKYNENSSLSITANPEDGYEFSGWTGTTESGSSINITVDSNLSITANFVRLRYSLTVERVGDGEVSQKIINSSRGTTEYESNTTIRLTATPASDFLFHNWKYLNETSVEFTYDHPLELIMDQTKTVTATFEEILPLVNPDNNDRNNTVGKWKIRKKGPGSQRATSARAVDCEVNEIILRSDYSFAVITATATLTGQYSIISNNEISLNQGETNIGSLTEIVLTENFISFNISLTDICDEQLEADKDPTYNETTDPIAPSNTGSQTMETASSTLASGPCTIETEITTDNVNQTVSAGNQIQDIIIDVTVASTCTKTLIVSSSNLPEGITVNLDNNKITVTGTPLANSIGSFEYEIILNIAEPEVILSGTITVENNATTETNSNQGGGGTDGSLQANSSTSSSNDNNCNIDTSINLQGTNGPNNQTVNSGESIKDIEYFISSDCTQEIKISSVTGLPEGVLTSISLFETILGIYGTPTRNVSGTYNFSIIIDNHIEETNNTPFFAATVSKVISGSITVINTATNTTETGSSTTSSDTTNTSNNDIENSSSSANNINPDTNSNVTSNTTQDFLTFNYEVRTFADGDNNNYRILGEDRLGELNSDADPDLNFRVGDQITFEVNASGHPFYLKTEQGTGTNNLLDGVNNNGTENGTISWTPTVAGTFYYQCSIHNNMNGQINVTE